MSKGRKVSEQERDGGEWDIPSPGPSLPRRLSTGKGKTTTIWIDSSHLPIPLTMIPAAGGLGRQNTEVSDLHPNVHTVANLHCVYTVEQNESK